MVRERSRVQSPPTAPSLFANCGRGLPSMPFCCVRTLRPTWMVPGDPSVRTPPLSFRWRATFQGCRLGFVPSPDIRDLIGTMAVSPASGQLVTPTCQQIAAWVVPSGPLRPDLPIWSIALSRCEYLFVGMRATATLFTLQISTTLNTTLPCSEKHPEIKALLGGSESPLPGQPLADPATSLWSWQSSVKAHPHPSCQRRFSATAAATSSASHGMCRNGACRSGPAAARHLDLAPVHSRPDTAGEAK